MNSFYEEVRSSVELVNKHYETQSVEEYFTFVFSITSGYEQASYAYLEAHKILIGYLKSQKRKISHEMFKERHQKFSKTMKEAILLTANPGFSFLQQTSPS